MPAELLRDVGRSGDRVGARRLSALPISIAAHVGATLAILIIPLAAEVDLPSLPLLSPDYVVAVPVPPPPPRPPMPRGSQPPVQRSTGAPIAAPPTIAPERNLPPVEAVPPGMDVIGGIDTGVTGGFGKVFNIEPPPPPPVAARPVAPVRPGGNIREPRKIVNVAPVYPPLAVSGGVEGIVILEAVINVRGEVEQLRVLRSIPLLDAAAIEAVQRWRYTPTLLNGVPVPVLMTITVHFKRDRQ